MIVQISKSSLQIIRLVAVLDGGNEEVDEPGEGVLVHWLDIGQLRETKEEDGGVLRYGFVPASRRVDLLLSGCGDYLLLGDLLRQDFRGRQHLNDYMCEL